MIDPYKTHGAFSWNELVTDDPAAAAAFYSELLGWETEEMPMEEMAYTVVKAGGTEIGGIMAKPPQAAEMPNAWGAYVTVDDVDAVVGRCEELGGKVVYGPADIPNVGRFAVILDPQMAALSIITYAMQE